MYGIEIRKKVLGLIAQGKTAAEVARFLKIGASSISRWLVLSQKGELAPKTHNPRKGKISVEALKTYVESYPDHTLSVIAQHFGVRISAIWYRLQGLGITLKERSLTIKKETKLSERIL